MIRAAIAEARVFDSWLEYQEALKRAIAPLTDEQLQRRPVAGQRSLGEIAEHIVFGRALHLYRTLGEATAGLIVLHTWDDGDDPPRSAVEIVQGLELTWRYIVSCIMHGSPMDTIADSEDPPVAQIIWGLFDHDLPHAGELSLLLGASGLPGVEI